jgi:dTDP-4-amino-4,6-dideoxygalactose transaminase
MSLQPIPFFNYSDVFLSHKADFMNIMEDVCTRGAFILQREVRELEEQLEEYLSAKCVLGVANGTDALIIALRAAGIGPGDEVIFSTHTYIATAASIYFVGATPIPVECQADHMIDPESVTKAITSKTKAIMPTQLNGRTCDMDALQEIADQHGLKIIEDSAQGLGSKFKGKSAGTFGIAGTISFYPAKNLGSFGDAGAVITNDNEMAEKMKLLRDHGRNEDGKVVAWGLNSRIDTLQAAILNYRMKNYDTIVKRRREIAQQYDQYLSQIEELVLPPKQKVDGNHFDVYQNYEIESQNRDGLKEYLKNNGIGTLVQWGGTAVHQHKELGFTENLPYTESLFEKMLMLPLNMSITDEEIKIVSNTIQEFYRK